MNDTERWRIYSAPFGAGKLIVYEYTTKDNYIRRVMDLERAKIPFYVYKRERDEKWIPHTRMFDSPWIIDKVLGTVPIEFKELDT